MKIKSLFIPKLDCFLEADYSQLEIRVLAFLAQDKRLQEDLAMGLDLHAIRASEWLKKPVKDVTPEERRTAKQISFQLQYGASAQGIAKNNNISVEEAVAFIDSYYSRYRGVFNYHEALVQEVDSKRKPSPVRGKHTGVPLGQSRIDSFTGRHYTIYEKESSYKPGKVSFYLPEMKNYPVQGLATGDIVPMALGRLNRALLSREYRSHICNTVHDSVLLDCVEAEVEVVAKLVKDTMESMPTYLSEVYGMEFNVPLPVDLKKGPNWGDLEKFEV